MPVTEIRSILLPDAEWWANLLRRWGDLMDKYCGLDPDDAPYWYGERALTGLLAAAAWNLPDGWSLEEFTAPRVWGDEPSSGRGDAWIGRGHAWWATLECKCAWVYSADLDSAVREVRQRIAEAKDQLIALRKDYRGMHQLAVCYVVPDLADGGPDATPERIQLLFDHLGTHFQDYALVAIYRPPDQFRHYDKRRCPGVVLVAELFSWPS